MKTSKIIFVDNFKYLLDAFILNLSDRNRTILHSIKIYSGWPEKNVPNFRMALCNRVGEMNQQKNMYVMSKHLGICL